jgi:cephalosporin hydroxylase
MPPQQLKVEWFGPDNQTRVDGPKDKAAWEALMAGIHPGLVVEMGQRPGGWQILRAEEPAPLASVGQFTEIKHTGPIDRREKLRRVLKAAGLPVCGV